MLKGKLVLSNQETEGNYQWKGIPAYMTPGFANALGPEVSLIVPTAVALIVERYPNNADYFQVFHYTWPDGKEIKFWLINDEDHMTFLLPSEY